MRKLAGVSWGAVKRSTFLGLALSGLAVVASLATPAPADRESHPVRAGGLA